MTKWSDDALDLVQLKDDLKDYHFSYQTKTAQEKLQEKINAKDEIGSDAGDENELIRHTSSTITTETRNAAKPPRQLTLLQQMETMDNNLRWIITKQVAQGVNHALHHRSHLDTLHKSEKDQILSDDPPEVLAIFRNTHVVTAAFRKMLTKWGQTFGLDPAQMVATANDSVNRNTQEQISIESIEEAGKTPGIEEISQLHDNMT